MIDNIKLANYKSFFADQVKEAIDEQQKSIIHRCGTYSRQVNYRLLMLIPFSMRQA